MSEEQKDVDQLITMEREIMEELKKMFNDESLSTSERVRVANALAYHAVVLDKLQTRKGEDQQFDEDSLGDFVAGAHYADGPMRRIVRRDFQGWQRRLSSRR